MTEILSEISPLWGICPFIKIQDRLIKCRAKQRLPENARSVIMLAFPYLLPADNYNNLNISKYAVSADYHDILGKKLETATEKLRCKYPNEEFEWFSDNSPIPEVYASTIAGIGVRGENSLLITKEFGSFVFIGEIVTTMPLSYGDGKITTCIKCGKCTDICPAGAIDNGIIDKSKCLSDVTQRKGELTESEINLIQQTGCVWGCDICQNVCPLNSNAKTTEITEFLNDINSEINETTPLEGRAFAWRGKKVIQRNLEIIKENL